MCVKTIYRFWWLHFFHSFIYSFYFILFLLSFFLICHFYVLKKFVLEYQQTPLSIYLSTFNFQDYCQKCTSELSGIVKGNDNFKTVKYTVRSAWPKALEQPLSRSLFAACIPCRPNSLSSSSYPHHPRRISHRPVMLLALVSSPA